MYCLIDSIYDKSYAQVKVRHSDLIFFSLVYFH